MTTLSYFEFNRHYQGMNIFSAKTNKKLIKASVYYAFHGEQSLLELDKNPDYIIRERTEKENDDWERSILNSSGKNYKLLIKKELEGQVN